MFVSKLINEFFRMINIKKTNTIPYHLRAEGMVEKLVRILLIYVGANQWD